MDRSYKQCTCGKRALSIATRCPACGRELLTPAVKERVPGRASGRLPSPRVAAGVLVAAAVLVLVRLAQTNDPASERSSLAAVGSIASTQRAYATATPELDTASDRASAGERTGKLLVARTWTSVRESRSKVADLAAVLLPGDTVLVDSLQRGWYRAKLEGEVLGYVHRSTLTA